MADFYVKQNDLLPALTGVLMNPNQSRLDLTNSSVQVELKRMDDATDVRLLNAAIIGNDPTQGLVEHIWQLGETAKSGSYFYRWIVTWPGQLPQSFPNYARGLVLCVEP